MVHRTKITRPAGPEMPEKDQNFFCKALAMSESLTCLARDRLKRLRIGPLDAILFDVVVEMLSADI